MKRMLAMVAGLAVVALMATATPAKEKKDSGPALQTFKGAISKIDGASITVDAKTDAGTDSKTFTTDSTTKVTLPADPATTAPKKGDGKGGDKAPTGKAGKVSDLKVGDNVVVKYDEQKLAHSITVMPAVAVTGGEGK